jgi:hypothetical protein
MKTPIPWSQLVQEFVSAIEKRDYGEVVKLFEKPEGGFSLLTAVPEGDSNWERVEDLLTRVRIDFCDALLLLMHPSRNIPGDLPDCVKDVSDKCRVAEFIELKSNQLQKDYLITIKKVFTLVQTTRRITTQMLAFGKMFAFAI